jgi:hypothetical protein
MCCRHHHSGYYWDWPERCYPRRHEGWSVPSPGEEYVRRLEEEREMLEQRLRRLEQELEALRRQARPTPE